jgi:hypothetical protein
LPAIAHWEKDPIAIELLVRLSADLDSDVRDWSCFGLGQLEADSPSARDALAGRLADEDVDTRCEALVSLAQTGDIRAYQRLEQRLDQEDLWSLELEAAAELAHVRLYPKLLRIRKETTEDENTNERFSSALENALMRCDPDRVSIALEMEASLLDRLQNSIADGLSLSVEGRYPRSWIVIEGGRRQRCRTPIWETTDDPKTFNLEQAAASILLTWHKAKG